MEERAELAKAEWRKTVRYYHCILKKIPGHVRAFREASDLANPGAIRDRVVTYLKKHGHADMDENRVCKATV